MRGKTVVAVVGLLVAGLGLGLYMFKRQADSDTASITNQPEQKLTADQMDRLTKGGGGDLRTVMKAAQQTGDMSTDQRLALWKGQLAAPQAPVRLKAVQELGEMARASLGPPASLGPSPALGASPALGPSTTLGTGCAPCVDLLRKAAQDDPDEDVRMIAGAIIEDLPPTGASPEVPGGSK